MALLDDADAPRMRELMEKYRDLPMDLADAALVRVAERDALTRSSRSIGRTSPSTVRGAGNGSRSCRDPPGPLAPDGIRCRFIGGRDVARGR